MVSCCGDLHLYIFTLIVFLINEYVANNPYIKKISDTLFSFIMTNVGFAVGLLEWIFGVKDGVYTPTITYRKDN